MNHFFGYYDVNPYSRDGKYHLALETSFQDHRPVNGESANVGVIDTSTGEFICLDKTRGFNFQQGSMMNWLDIDGKEVFCYNDIRDGKLVTVLFDFQTHEKRVFQGAVSGVAEGKLLATSLNYIRNFQCRPVAGQTGRPEKRIDENDGLFLLDLKTGKRKLILSMDRLASALHMKQIDQGWMWFDHTTFNPSGTRILFFVRICREDGKGWYSSLWTIGVDGTDLRNQIDYTHWISHYDWRDDETVLITADINGKPGFYLFKDGSGIFEPFHHDVMPSDGHGCYSPDREFVACDTYPSDEDNMCELFVLRVSDGKKLSCGNFYAPKLYRGDIRCDLHPRWNYDGTKLSFDSVHGEYRQIYEVEM